MRIAIERADGGVSIMEVIDETKLEDCLQKWSFHHGAVVSYRVIGLDDHPQDRTFRNAWKPDLTVCMDRAREIHMGRIREKRNERLTELDKRKYGADYDSERHKLRNIPQEFDLSVAATPDELKKLWPDELK